jgi:CBS-domain-containing membrane protein
MPVTDDQGHVIGVVTELNLLEAAQGGRDLIKTTAEEIMTTEVVTADVDTPVSELIRIMTDKQVIRLPITAKGKLVGVVARCDVLKTLIEPEFVTYA